ncbi:DUF2797 domain-containing protein [Methanocella sp. CWC-04]|uniref:DUF2797 domain-containing protein n=1 Tax=Methanooceanicella nereidis TaxID=2052831 RepID=A0AAP2RDK5_9EURY|nr:DUF2797 domain-containing protein [Methanocella sp. CWC-04]MCD1295651.1 DUF2797 domain-containing protein [Methanocella sp. CWC-04]
MRIIGYSSIDKSLIVYPRLKEIDISNDIAMVLKERGCAGRWAGDQYIPCESHDHPYCSRCAAPDPCIICKGECLKSIKTCCIEHSVYLAVFAPDILKVGVSKTHRLETRLKEQGADIGFEIVRLPDGELARRREQTMAQSIRDKVSYKDKLNGISKRVSERLLQDIYRDYDAERVMSFKYFRDEIRMKPILIEPKEEMAISGKVLGIKGQVLVIEKRNTVYAVNLDDLIGYDMEPGKGSINLQSSLFEFSEEETV